MLSKQIFSPDTDYKKNILCLGRLELEDPDLKEFSLPEIVSHFTKLPASQIYYLQQEHGNVFHYVQSQTQLPLQGDALFTDEKEIVLVVKTADCIPLFFWSESNDFIGVIHSGWRGTRVGITERVVSHIQKEFGLLDLNFFSGPSIRQLNYEVGEDVATSFMEDFPDTLIPLENNKYLFANDKALQAKLERLSASYKINDCGICNYQNKDYYSHRRKDSGRNLNLIWMSTE